MKLKPKKQSFNTIYAQHFTTDDFSFDLYTDSHGFNERENRQTMIFKLKSKAFDSILILVDQQYVSIVDMSYKHTTPPHFFGLAHGSSKWENRLMMKFKLKNKALVDQDYMSISSINFLGSNKNMINSMYIFFPL